MIDSKPTQVSRQTPVLQRTSTIKKWN